MIELKCDICGVDMTKKILRRGKKVLNIGFVKHPREGEGKVIMRCKNCHIGR